MSEVFITSLPPQKVATSQKTKKWFMACIDGAISNISSTTLSTYRRSYYQKKVLRDLEYNVLTPTDVESTTTVMAGVISTDNNDQLQLYPLVKPRIDLLIGESIKRRFNWSVKVVNEDSISDKEKLIKEQVTKELANLAMSKGYTEEKLQQKLNELNKWVLYEAQDIRERMASQILSHLDKELHLPIHFMDGIGDALNIGEEIYCVDIVAGEPVLRRVDPLNIWTVRHSNSYKIEDSDIIIEDGYVSTGRAIDEFYDYLASSEIDKLLDTGGTSSSLTTDGSISTNSQYPTFTSDLFGDTKYVNALSYGPFDLNGNVRRTRVVWRGLRKIGVKTFYDELGILQEHVVDENYKANPELGEKIKWMWISEWYEGTRLANDIYVKMQSRPIQFRRMDNLSACSSGYVGTVYPQSMLEISKPYLYFYAQIMHELKKAIKKFKAPKIELDLSKIPDDWKLEDWLYYAEEMGYLIVDSFKEGNKGTATGKLAGNFNTTGKAYNLDMGNYIQHLQLILAFIERQIAIITGVTDQRLGQIENRETVGGVERSVTQSSHITEKIFALHDNTKIRAMELLLETAKYAWRNDKSKKKQYVLDDLSSVILNIDGELFNESEYGVFVSNASDDTELIASMKQLAHAMLQNDKITVTDLMTILTAPSVSSMRRELERSEQERQQSAQKQLEAEQQAQEKDLQVRLQIEQDKNRITEESNIRDNETKLVIAGMAQGMQDNTPETIEPEQDMMEQEKLNLDREKVTKDSDHKNRALDETIRHNKVTEEVSRIKKPVVAK